MTKATFRQLLFRVITCSCLTGSLAIGVVWVRSRLWTDVWRLNSALVRSDKVVAFREWEVRIGNGGVVVNHAEYLWISGRETFDPNSYPSGLHHSLDPSLRYPRLELVDYTSNPITADQSVIFDQHGFGFLKASAVWDDRSRRETRQSGVFPLWLPALALLVLPAMRVKWDAWKRKRANRAKRGLCGNCGYDLRQTAERCPECGTLKGVGVL